MILLSCAGAIIKGHRAYHLGSTLGTDELHAFAKRIGLEPEWFQDKKHPHYDVFGAKVLAVISAGVEIVSQREYARRVAR